MKNKMYLNVTLTFLFACLMASTSFAQNITIENGTNGHGYLENTTGYIGIRPANATHGLILRDHTGATTAWSGIRLVNNGSSDRMEFTVAGNNYGKSLVLMQNNRVGIGTTNPLQKLDVKGGIRASNANDVSNFIELNHGGANSYINHGGVGRMDFRMGGANKMVLTPDGKLGLGVDDPQAKLHIASGLRTAKWNDADEYMNMYYGGFSRHGTGGIYFGINSQNVLTLAPNGNVGMGTNSPDNKLDVKGTIRAEECKIELGWSDYVFYDDYQLPTLAEEAAHIEANGHLLGFESEKAMGGEIQLGDVSKRQQAKIEEMMLHLIEIKKEIKQLKEENEQLKAQVSKK